MKKSIRINAALAALVLALAACDSEADVDLAPGVEDRSGDTLAEVFGDEASISAVSGLIASTGVLGAFEGEANYTLLAPSNTAIDALGADAAQMLTDESNGAIAAAVIREHMVPGLLTEDAIRSAVAANGGEVTMRTYGTGNVTFAQDGETLTVKGANGTTANLTGGSIVASNGSVLTIDTVLADTSAF